MKFKKAKIYIQINNSIIFAFLSYQLQKKFFILIHLEIIYLKIMNQLNQLIIYIP